MKLLKTKINGPKIIKTQVFTDNRGFLKEIFRNTFLKNTDFVFDVLSSSKKNVLRGLHIQTKNPQAKIITVAHGKIFDVAVDLRINSNTFGKYVSVTMSDKDNFSFYIPKGFAHGFVCLSKKCTIYYKNSNYRHAGSETTINWNDEDVKIKWPIKKPILSQKDGLGISLKDFVLLNK
jgi:dTDP-4-dehydrorhamnose 3,5-epimerase